MSKEIQINQDPIGGVIEAAVKKEMSEDGDNDSSSESGEEESQTPQKDEQRDTPIGADEFNELQSMLNKIRAYRRRFAKMLQSADPELFSDLANFDTRFKQLQRHPSRGAFDLMHDECTIALESIHYIIMPNNMSIMQTLVRCVLSGSEGVMTSVLNLPMTGYADAVLNNPQAGQLLAELEIELAADKYVHPIYRAGFLAISTALMVYNINSAALAQQRAMGTVPVEIEQQASTSSSVKGKEPAIEIREPDKNIRQ